MLLHAVPPLPKNKDSIIGARSNYPTIATSKEILKKKLDSMGNLKIWGKYHRFHILETIFRIVSAYFWGLLYRPLPVAWYFPHENCQIESRGKPGNMVGQYHRTILDSMKPVALMWWGDPACATSAPPCWTVIWGLSAAGSTSSVHCADLTQNLGIVVISKKTAML